MTRRQWSFAAAAPRPDLIPACYQPGRKATSPGAARHPLPAGEGRTRMEKPRVLTRAQGIVVPTLKMVPKGQG